MDCCYIAGVALEDSREGKTFFWEGLKELARGMVCTRQWQKRWLDDQRLGDIRVKGLGTEDSEEEVCSWTFSNGHRVKDNCYPCDCSTKGICCREDSQ